MNSKTFMFNWFLSISLGSLLLGVLAFFDRLGGHMGELMPAFGVMIRVAFALTISSGVLSIPYVILGNITIFKVESPVKQRNRLWLFHWVGSALLFVGMTVLGAVSLHWTLGTATLPYILFGSIFHAFPRIPPKWFPI